MIATADTIHDFLARRLRCEGDASIVVWLDPGRYFEHFVNTGLFSSKVMVIQPSVVLRQRLELESRVPDTIIYATSREVLEPIEELVQCFGTIRTFDVGDLIADRVLPGLAAQTTHARAHPNLLLFAWDRIGSAWWAGGDLDLGLALALRGRTDGDIIDLALAELDRAGRDGVARLPPLPSDADQYVAAILQERFSLEVPGTTSALGRFALIADYASVPSGLSKFGHLLENTNHGFLDALVGRLAESRKRLNRVRELLHYAQEQLGASLAGFTVAELAKLRIAPGRIDTLATAIRAEADAVGPKHAFEILRTHEGALRDEEFLAAFAQALDFEMRIDEGRDWLSGASKSSDEFIVKYAESLNEIDQLYRHCVAVLEGALRLACETLYREWLRDLNVAFAAQLDSEPVWRFRNRQRDLGISFASLKGRCAVVIFDALRFEMGREVFERLPKTTLERRLEWAVASLPTKTEVGMSALVPSADELSLAADGTKLVVRIGTRVTTAKSARDEIWKAAGFRVLWNVDLPREQVDDERIVVFHDAVDAIGETLQDDAFSHYEQLITEIAKLVNDLARRGYTVVATADHGFLTLPPSTDNKIVLGKAADDDVRKRRYRVSSAEALPEPVVSRSVRALGFEGDVTIGFPPGASIFQTQGALGFVHGGIALQELVIPVLRVSAKKVAPTSAEPPFQVQFPKRLVSRAVAVAVVAKTTVAPETALRLRIRTSDDATTDKRFVWAPDAEGRLVMRALLAEDAPPGDVELTVMIDAGPLVATTTIGYEPHE